MSHPWNEVDDPWADETDARHRITRITRRDIFDYLRTCDFPWYGKLDEVAFLGRLYDLHDLPSTDARFETAADDIQQHRINNYDWDDDWIFADSRLQLGGGGPDDVLLEFLAQLVHPVVRVDTAQASEIVGTLNELLRPDGWAIAVSGSLSGRPIYAPTRLDEDTATTVRPAARASTPGEINKRGSIDAVTDNIAPRTPDPRKVFLVHGRNDAARDAMTEFLRALDLTVISWTSATNLAQHEAGQPPTTLDIVKAGISAAAGVIVLFTPDDQVRLHPALAASDGSDESRPIGQARPNVILEAGIALAIAPSKVQMVRMGRQREISDIAGINFANIGDGVDQRQDLALRLRGLKLAVNLDDVGRWTKAGNFNDALGFLAAPPPFDHDSGADTPEGTSNSDLIEIDPTQNREALRPRGGSIRRGTMSNTKVVFIAYAIEDERQRDFLKGQTLSSRAPHEFVDMSAKEPYDAGWKDKVRTRIRRSDGVIVLVSANSLNSTGQAWEIACARDEHKPIRGIWAYRNDRTSIPGVTSHTWNDANITSFIDSI